jgi:hypothetical protein
MIDIPAHWIPGQLLDLRRYQGGVYRATLLGEEIDREHPNYLEFDSSFDAQQFISGWYANKRTDPRA